MSGKEVEVVALKSFFNKRSQLVNSFTLKYKAAQKTGLLG